MSEPQEDDQITNRVIKAQFHVMDPKIIARVKEIAADHVLQTDPNILADDLQTIAVLALQAHENLEVLIQLIEEIAKAGTITVEPPAKPPKRRRL